MEARSTLKQPIHIRSACKAVLTVLNGAPGKRGLPTWNPQACRLMPTKHEDRFVCKSMNVRVGTKGLSSWCSGLHTRDSRSNEAREHALRCGLIRMIHRSELRADSYPTRNKHQ